MAIAPETIAALATPRGEGGVSIVRISGPEAAAILGQVFRPVGKLTRYENRRMYLGHVILADGSEIDQVLAVYMRAPATYTGEDVVEIQAHGGLVVTGEVLHRVLEAGARLAFPGEFTERAFLSGKIDLTQAEAVIDLIQASASRAAKQAARHLEGEFSLAVRQIRDGVVQLLAKLRVAVDFPEEDLPALAPQLLKQELSQLAAETDRLLATSRVGRVIREGMRVVIAGRPNVGKSSLLNALVGQEKAIVTAFAGTTRDIVEEHLVWSGVPVRLADTAGLHEADDPVERIGVERARQAVSQADLVLVVLDRSQPLQPADWQVLQSVEDRPHLVVWNKADLAPAKQSGPDLPQEPLAVAATTGLGLAELQAAVVAEVIGQSALDDSLLVANARQQQALAQAAQAIHAASATLSAGLPEDMLSVDLEQALTSLGKLLGETTDEAVIREIFSRFCIGK